MAHLRRLRRRLGHRGAVLIAFGLTWTFIGLATLSSPATPGTDALWFEQWPDELRCALWVISGLTAMAYAFTPRGGRDQVGFAALYVVPFLRLLSYETGWFMSLDLPDWVPYLPHDFGDGYPRGLIAGAVYAVYLAVIVITSLWPEAPSEEAPSE